MGQQIFIYNASKYSTKRVTLNYAPSCGPHAAYTLATSCYYGVRDLILFCQFIPLTSEFNSFLYDGMDDYYSELQIF